MKTKIVHFGDSSAISIPEPLLQQCHFQDEVNVELRGGCLVISLSKTAREGWDAAFQKMHEAGDDRFILNETATSNRQNWSNCF
ncbi:MAG: AbrB/MazE/SpoVT family DNA-binding domain-containing protein [Verrucomicrobiota bacterium]|nr:AbrB/MazE/SpoVT family DNA-binding domain-containing protein [Verrucomicrobiota bacterium]